MGVFSRFTLPAEKPTPASLLFMLMCLLLPTVALFNARALVPVIAVSALGLLVTLWRSGTLAKLGMIDRYLAAFAGGYICVVLFRSFGTPDVTGSLTSLAKLVGIAVMAASLAAAQHGMRESDRTWIFIAFLVSVSLTALWILLDVATDSAITNLVFGYDNLSGGKTAVLSLYGYFWYKSATTVLVISALVLCIYIQKKAGMLPALVLLIACAAAAHLVGSRTASLGVIISLGAGIVYQLLGRYRLKVLLAMLALAFFLPFWISVSGLSAAKISAGLEKEQPASYSIVYRLHIWEFVTGKIIERPALGWGTGASKRLGTDAVPPLTDPTFGTLGEPIPVHPHNGILQVWLEFGAAGALAAFLFLARLLIVAERAVRSAGQRIWVFSAVAMIACFLGFNFSISSSWWLASIAGLAALVAIFVDDQDSGLPT